jgi:hypothetical protein
MAAFFLAPSPRLGEGGDCRVARRLVAAGRRAVFVMAVGDAPHPLPILRRCLRHEDAPDYLAVSKHVVVILAIADRVRVSARLKLLDRQIRKRDTCLHAGKYAQASMSRNTMTELASAGRSEVRRGSARPASSIAVTMFGGLKYA